MPRIFSDEFNRRANSVENVDFPVTIVEINHPELAVPIRLVDDNQDITSNGDLYIAIAMEITWPDDTDNSSNISSQLIIDNIGKELVSWLETAAGGEGATVTISAILRSDPDNIEYTHFLDTANIAITQFKVNISLIFPDTNNKSTVAIVYRPENTPPLF